MVLELARLAGDALSFTRQSVGIYQGGILGAVQDLAMERAYLRRICCLVDLEFLSGFICLAPQSRIA